MSRIVLINLLFLILCFIYQSLRHHEMKKVLSIASRSSRQRLIFLSFLDLLKQHQRDPPSLCLHLYPTYFKFEHEVCTLYFSTTKTNEFFNLHVIYLSRMASFLIKVNSK